MVGGDGSMLVLSENSTTSPELARRLQACVAVTRVKRRAGSRPRIVNPAALRASAAALGAFGLVALLDEPTLLDREVYDWARRNYDRRIELAQWPIELFGLPG